MIFDPSETWAQKSQFEDSLAAFFGANGLQAEIVQEPGSRESNKRVLLISKTPEMPETEEKPEGTIKQLKAQMTTKRGYSGRYEKK